MNSFKRHIYKNNKVNKKVTLLTLDPTSATLSSSLPNDVVVQVSSNSSWSVGQIPDWFSIIGGSGSGDGGFSITSIGDNPDDPRSFALIVSTNTSNGSLGVTKTFTINQEGELYPHYVAFDDTNESNACGASPDTNVWSDSSTFQNSSILYRNDTGSLTVVAGFYSKENFFLQCNSEGVVTNSDVCLIL